MRTPRTAKQMNLHSDILSGYRNKSGTLTSKGWAAGGIERKKGPGYNLAIRKDGPAFLIQGFVDDPSGSGHTTDKHISEGYPTATQARKRLAELVRYQKSLDA